MLKKISLIVLCLFFILNSGNAFGQAWAKIDKKEGDSKWSKVVPNDTREELPPAGKPSTTDIVPFAGAPKSFDKLVEKISPAVVNISTTQRIRPTPYNPFGPYGPRTGPNDPLDDFFKKFFGENPQGQRPMHSLGSGFMIDKSGRILTNNHVVADANEIVVTLSDERKFKAKVVGRDPETDIAVIDVESDSDLPFVNLGDSDTLDIGDWVVAIGNPFGLSHTVTAGIVSAKGRVIGAGPYDNFIQTDASINPGNSGGPLFDMSGRVVGINTAIFAGGQGLGFAIPVNMAKKLVPQLVKHGKVTDRGWLGVVVQGITPELARSFKLPEDQKGGLVADVKPNSPAERSGLLRGDVVVEFNGKMIKHSSQLPGIVAATPPDKEIDVEIIRQGEKMTLKVVLGKRESMVKDIQPQQEESGVDKLGMVVQDLSDADAHKLGVEPGKGVIVERIEPGSVAENAEIMTGDLVYQVNDIDVNSKSEYIKTLSDIKSTGVVRLLIKRGGATYFFALSMQ